jgi:hypothetical protein
MQRLRRVFERFPTIFLLLLRKAPLDAGGPLLAGVAGKANLSQRGNFYRSILAPVDFWYGCPPLALSVDASASPILRLSHSPQSARASSR